MFLPSDDIWTGTNFGGVYSTIPTEQACSDWTSASMQDGARIGQVGMGGANWTAFAATTCDQLAPKSPLRQSPCPLRAPR